MPINEGKIYNGLFLAILVVAIIVVVLCLCSHRKSNFTIDPTIDSNIIGANVSLGIGNLGPDTCPITSLNEFTIADKLGIKKFREWYPDSLAIALSYIDTKLDPKPIAGISTVMNPTQQRLQKIIQYLYNNNARFTLVLNTDYWDCFQKSCIPSTGKNRNTHPAGGDYGLTFEEMMRVKTQNGGYMVEAIHLGLDGGSQNQVEVSLRRAQLKTGTGAKPITDVVNTLISYLPAERKVGGGGTPVKIIISAQGDDCVDATSSIGGGWGEISGPANDCSERYGGIDWSTLKGLLTTQLQDINKLGYPVYLATTKYPYYYVGNDNNLKVSMPDTYAGTIGVYIQSVKNLNQQLGTNFKPMIAETGWPSTCDGGIVDDKGNSGSIPNLNAKKIRASSCNQSNMWKYFVSPLYNNTQSKTTITVNGKQYNPSDFSTDIKGVERFWWVLSGDGTHVDCYNPEHTNDKEGIYYRDNGWSMFTKRGDFKYPYPNLTVVDGQGSDRTYPPCVYIADGICPPVGGINHQTTRCCTAGQRLSGIDPTANAIDVENQVPCCYSDMTFNNNKHYVGPTFC